MIIEPLKYPDPEPDMRDWNDTVFKKLNEIIACLNNRDEDTKISEFIKNILENRKTRKTT